MQRDVYDEGRVLLEERRDYADLRRLALDAVRRTREALLSSGSRELGEHCREIKSEADQTADAALRQALLPGGLPILSEEGHDVQWASESGLHWVVDPLDGTVNYMRGLPPARIAVALCSGSTALYGIIAAVTEDRYCEGGVGIGFTSSRPASAPWRRRSLNEAIVLTGFPAGRSLGENDLDDFRQLLFSVRRVRLWGSAAASIEMVALGHADGYVERGIGFWDVAAGLALLHGAHVPFRTGPMTRAGRLDVFAGCTVEIFPAVEAPAS
jgi:myo-inositol-1(or 4)-monophosphatase